MISLDIERLITPITDSNPAGPSLRYETIYDEIREARRGDDANLPQGVWEIGLKHPDWATVIKLCVEGLENQSKDLQLAIWLTEAATYQFGYTGLVDGCKVIHQLLVTFWETLHPLIDEDEDLSARITCLEWFCDRVSLAVSISPLTQTSLSSNVTYHLADWRKALGAKRRGSDTAQDEGNTSTNPPVTIDRATVRDTIEATPIEWRRENTNAAVEAGKAIRKLSEETDRLFGSAAPSYHILLNAVDEVIQIYTDHNQVDEMPAEDHMEAGFAKPEPVPQNSQNGETVDSKSALATGHQVTDNLIIRSRADAYAKLAGIASYLKKIEPHSPAPYLMMRAVTWGNMTLPQLLSELNTENSDIRQLYALLGIGEED